MSSPAVLSRHFNAYEVRTTLVNGEVFYHRADVCEVLDLSNPRQYDFDDQDVYKVYGLAEDGKRREMAFISEFATFQLIMRSNKPEAREFQRWVYETTKAILAGGQLPITAKAAVTVEERIKVIVAASSIVGSLKDNPYLAANVLRLMENEFSMPMQQLTSSLPTLTDPRHLHTLTAMDMAVKLLGAKHGDTRAAASINDALIELGYLTANKELADPDEPECDVRPGPPLHGGKGRTVATRFWSKKVLEELEEHLNGSVD